MVSVNAHSIAQEGAGFMLQYIHMKRLSIIFLLILTFGFWTAPTATYASCACWCETDNGATTQGSVEDSAACQSSCDDYLGCYTDEQVDLSPNYNTLCWTRNECESSFSTGEIASEWDGQTSFCVSGEGVCYSAPEPVDLNVAIGSLTQAESLGDYINAVYSWALAAGSLLAVVMLMLGGLQYMLARGQSDAIGKAKKRMTNAVTGIVLLFATYAIANFIDPRFTIFNRLSPPKIRTTVFIDPDASCDAMLDAGLSIEPSSVVGQECGDKSIISDTGDVQSTVAVGGECVWDRCDEHEVCMSTTVDSAEVNNGYVCVRCGMAHHYGITPSSSTCASLDPDGEGDDYFCEYDPGLWNLGVSYTMCTELVYPESYPSLNCDMLRSAAKSGDSISCRAYDLVMATYLNSELIDIGEQELEYNEVDDFETSDGQFDFLEAVCTNDPCGLAPPGESCVVFALDPDEEVFTVIAGTGAVAVVATGGLALPLVLPIVGIASLAAWAGGDEVLANCANESSNGYGIRNCKDENGDDTDCNPRW